MAFDRRTREKMLEMCGEIREDDGVDPREFFKAGRDPRKEDHKTKQLCRQAAETLDQVFGGETGDPRLACLRVVSVQPAPDASRLLVTLIADCPAEELSLADTEAALAASSGRLRATVAGAITRKRAPNLVFTILPPGQEEVIR